MAQRRTRNSVPIKVTEYIPGERYTVTGGGRQQRFVSKAAAQREAARRRDRRRASR